MGPSVLQTALYAAEKHAKQKRRYTDDPYINHPLAVAAMVQSINEYEYAGANPDLEKAALLHDVVEDCGITFDELEQRGFDRYVCDVVYCLTDVYTKDAFPESNRKDRKSREFIRWHALSQNDKTMWRAASLVKLADLYDNACSIKQYDPKFWITYREEALEMIKFLYSYDKISTLLMSVLQEKNDS